MNSPDYTKWKLPQGAKARLGKGYINDIRYSPDSSRLAVASSIGIWIYDAETGEELNLFTGHSGPVDRLAYSPNGHFIASSSDDKTVRLWDTVTGEQKVVLNHDNNVTDFLYSPDGSTIITNSQGKACLWNANTGEQKATFTERLYDTSFHSVAYSPDASTIASIRSSSCPEICLWDAITGELKATITGISFVYSPDGKIIAINSYQEIEVEDQDPLTPLYQEGKAADGSTSMIKSMIKSYKKVRLWDTVTGEHKMTLTHAGDVWNVLNIVYSPGGETITTEGGQAIYLWDAITGELKATFTGESFAYSPDGGTIATEDQREICLWDAVTGEHKTTFAADTAADTYVNYLEIPSLKYPSSLEYSPDGKTIAAWIPYACIDDEPVAMVCLWDITTGEHKAFELDGTGGFEYISDGKTIAIESYDRTLIYLWDVVIGKRKATLEHKTTLTDDFISFQYSSNGSTIASKSSKVVYLWDAVTGEHKAIFTEHVRSVFSIAYSSDNKTIAIRSGPKGEFRDDVTEISLWDLSTTERKETISEHPCYIFFYSPDGSAIITYGMHGKEGQHIRATRGIGDGCVIRLWDVNTGKHKVTLEEHAYNVESFAVSPDGSTLITKGTQRIENIDHFGQFIRLWDATTGEYKTTLIDDRNSGGGFISFAYSPDGSTIAVGEDRGIWLPDVVTGERKIVLVDDTTLVDHGYNFGIENLVYSPDGKTMATWKNYGHEVHLWDSATGTHKTTLRHINSDLGCYIEDFAYSPDGKTIATKSRKNVYLWNASTGERKVTLVHKPIGFNLAYSPDGSTIATWNDKEVNLWDTTTGKEKITITKCIGDISCLAYSSDGKTIATGSKDGTVLLWEVPASFYKDPGINPREIHGNWRAGWALDIHTVSSRPLPGGGYDTERTEFGELVFQLKYRHDRSKIQLIAEITAKFVEEKFAVDGHLVLPYIAAVIPIPPSDTNRDFQPVTEVAQEIGKLLSVPVRTDYLMKVKRTEPLKNLPDVENKREQLRGAFVVESQGLKDQCVLLVDDLYDSGTTLREATKVLYEQGSVQHVLVLTLTRTRTGRD